ncbi:prepilin peptidase [Parvularcula sp. IMCC14364]|uniref:A24 family peptidase n=1 Tax=Parvularcula sp. IMCC14364 TaxID=3067902 RepID=UPI002740C1B2|nr:prepilin peptidase [Parvularcula sp. IMCC14364]
MLSYILVSILPASWLIAAINDLGELKIPNWISITLVLAFPVMALCFGYSIEMLSSSIALALGVLVLGFAIYTTGQFGAGDVKLLAATALWVGPAAFPMFLFKVILASGIFAFAIIMFRSTPMLPVYAHAPWLMELHGSRRAMPYGVGIALGGFWSLHEAMAFLTVFG